jgi:hypothetical protein
MSILSLQKQSQNTDFPNVRPSLDLRFALAKKLDPRITFTRGSTGTYFGPDGLMKTAGVNEPRFDHDPISGQSLGLLIEESRQNLLTYSEDFSDASWIKVSSSISTNQIASPDGLITAEKLVEDTANAQHFVLKTRTGSNETVTFSVFCKAAERTRVFLQLSNSVNATAQVVYNLSTGTAGSPNSSNADYSNISASMIAYPNGWYRCILTATKGSVNTNNYPTISTVNNSGSAVYTGDGTSGIYIWGPQVEEGAFPTSYIPTSASTVTRSADTANISGTNFSNFFNSTEGTLFVDSEMPYQTVNKFPAIGFSNGGGASNCIQFYYYNTSSPWVAWLVRNFADAAGGGTVAANLIEAPGFTNTPGVYKKLAGTYKFGEFNYYFDGKIVSRTTPNKRLPTVNLLEIGKNGSTVNRLNGHIRRITYYPIAITNTQMVNLTS